MAGGGFGLLTVSAFFEAGAGRDVVNFFDGKGGAVIFSGTCLAKASES